MVVTTELSLCRRKLEADFHLVTLHTHTLTHTQRVQILVRSIETQLISVTLIRKSHSSLVGKLVHTPRLFAKL